MIECINKEIAVASINEYMAELNLDQLRHARDRADALIAELEKQEKVLVWAVQDADMVLDWFLGADYVQAAEYLLAEAKKNEENRKNLKPHHMKLQLVPDWMTPDECKEMGLMVPNAELRGDKSAAFGLPLE